MKSSNANQGRRKFLGLTGTAGLSTFAAQAIGVNLGMVDIVQAQAGRRAVTPFRFAIISDPHLYSAKDHVFDRHLEDAVAQVNGLASQPDMVFVLGDVSHHGEADQIAKGKQILSKLKAPIRSIPGEHDWYLDMGAAWKAAFGAENWSFDHKGVRFIGMNSIIVPDFWTSAGLTPAQRRDWFMALNSPVPGLWGVADSTLEWLAKEVAPLPAETPVVVFTHSPLWDYYPRWNFQVSNSKQIRDILGKFTSVMAFHGHVHHTVFNRIGNLSSIGTMSTSWPWPYPPIQLPYPEFQSNRVDPSNTQDGMGTATVAMDAMGGGFVVHNGFADSVNPAIRNGFKV
ncbi:MAG: metallophosphoesterase [Rubrivivax sp.]|jgi:calcineurin-like phosphoesterase family protein|nr:metallophosphoesterase [Rubrivivax sp.]